MRDIIKEVLRETKNIKLFHMLMKRYIDTEYGISYTKPAEHPNYYDDYEYHGFEIKPLAIFLAQGTLHFYFPLEIGEWNFNEAYYFEPEAHDIIRFQDIAHQYGFNLENFAIDGGTRYQSILKIFNGEVPYYLITREGETGDLAAAMDYL
jgi:hypothetical protein